LINIIAIGIYNDLSLPKSLSQMVSILTSTLYHNNGKGLFSCWICWSFFQTFIKKLLISF